ncbi:ATP-dependent helicase [Neolewinella aurantiaca]|uniref:DNA 3'-5' helicase n=1 Tax=Neolewinella aurantiaca TaxID=2602767 RepID=A0A5C7FWL2_9BACT|nr:ATP-dependent helicase [Neolewinella aurantiaca]TXF91045.1 ATP-dependent helicase [Neolewinella aurantiaca]
MTFTPEQERIFDFVRNGEGHGIIDAVAGAGKTTTIMECARFAKDPSRVLFCAFNNSIAKEIGRRFREQGMQEVTVQTIHSLGLRILRENTDHHHRLEMREHKYSTIYRGEQMQTKLSPHIRALCELNNLNPKAANNDSRQSFAIKNLKFRIQRRLLDINQKHRATLNGPSFEDFVSLVEHFGVFTPAEEKSKTFREELEIYYAAHRLLLTAGTDMAARSYIIDFTDMIYLPFIWKLNATSKYDWIFIDECQDLSKAQFAVAAKYGKKGSRVLAVGDPRQSIYGFTGADVESFSRVARMTRATELPLTTCFRCPAGVIGLAQKIREDIVGAKEEYGTVDNIIVDEVVERARPGDLIISRLRAPLLVLIFDFIDQDVKVQVAEDEAREFINELKSLFKQDELQASIKRRYRGFEALKDIVLQRNRWVIRQNAAKIPKATEREVFLEAENEYLEKRLDFLHKKWEIWQKQCTTVSRVLEKIKAYVSARKGAIKLSTIHRAKGLEEDRVFIIDYDKLPMGRPQQKDWEKEQEINLKYVAITRAKEALFLVESEDTEEMEEDSSLFDALPFTGSQIGHN